jgi:hypothetical protein
MTSESQYLKKIEAIPNRSMKEAALVTPSKLCSTDALLQEAE